MKDVIVVSLKTVVKTGGVESTKNTFATLVVPLPEESVAEILYVFCKTKPCAAQFVAV